jgi:hypothetical protein
MIFPFSNAPSFIGLQPQESISIEDTECLSSSFLTFDQAEYLQSGINTCPRIELHLEY